MTRKIPLHGKAAGKFMLVDDEDYDVLSQYKWYESSVKRKGVHYLQATQKIKGKTYSFKAHRLVAERMGLPGGRYSFRDMDWLNHTRANIIPITRQQARTRGRIQQGKVHSEYQGVKLTEDGTWSSNIYPDGKQIHLGIYPAPEMAAAAYNGAAIALFGEFARLNPIHKPEMVCAQDVQQDAKIQ